MLNAPAIRRMVHAEIASRMHAPAVIDEARLFGAIADVFVPSALHAFEIKSAVDDLRRFPRQAAALERTFPLVTLVTVEAHLAEARTLVGPAWGLWVATSGIDGDRIRCERAAQLHDELRPAWLLGALRAHELRQMALANGLPSSGGRGELAAVLLRRLGARACVRLAHTLLSAPARWRGPAAPWSGPVLCAMEMPLFPLPVR
jgi:hypothetical protein